MTALTWVLLAFAVIGLLFGLWQWTARRRTVQRLDNMLEQSISSGFTEEHFDETELSALETKFARFLRGSAHTQKTMKTEQEAVKTLISDISHQTRTPIANLLVYASLLTESDLSPRQREQVQALLTQVSYTHLRAHETKANLVCSLLLEKKKNNRKAAIRSKKHKRWI